jgi:hypothetical protein
MNFRFRFLLFSFCLISKIAIGQDAELGFETNPFLFQTSDASKFSTYQNTNVQIGLIGNFYLSSTAINGSIVKDLLNNKTVDEQEELNSEQGMSTLNDNYGSFGYDAGMYVNIHGNNLPLLHEGVFHFALYQRAINEIQFTKDLYHFATEGNKNYAGDTAQFPGSSYLNEGFRQFQIGVQKDFQTGENKIEAGIALSFLQGISFSDFSVVKGHLYTSPQSDYIRLTSVFDYYHNDGNYSDFGNFNGVGYAGDIYAAYKDDDNSLRVQIAVNDIGRIYWNNKTVLQNFDSSDRLSGTQLQDLFSYTNSSFRNISTQQILETIGVKDSLTSIHKRLPYRLSLTAYKGLDNNLIGISGGISYRSEFDPTPYFFVNGDIHIYDFAATLHLGAGGTGGGEAGLAVSYHLKENFYFEIGSNNLIYLFSPSSAYSASVYSSIEIGF